MPEIYELGFLTQLPTHKQTVLMQGWAEIKNMRNKLLEDFVRIGGSLKLIREVIGNSSQYELFTEKALGMSLRMAERYEQIHTKYADSFQDLAKIPNVPMGVYLELARPEFPEEAKQKLLAGSEVEVEGKAVGIDTVTLKQLEDYRKKNEQLTDSLKRLQKELKEANGAKQANQAKQAEPDKLTELQATVKNQKGEIEELSEKLEVFESQKEKHQERIGLLFAISTGFKSVDSQLQQLDSLLHNFRKIGIPQKDDRETLRGLYKATLANVKTLGENVP